MFETILPFLLTGFVFGLSGGIAPGPTMAIVIAQAVRHNWKEGAKVAIAPLITDGPIIVVGLFVLSLLNNILNGFLGVVSILGACFLGYLAYESFKAQRMHVDVGATKPRSVLRGIIANALNPSPYMFWFTLGCPTILKAWDVGAIATAGFLTSFFIGLVGTKVVIALIVVPFRSFLETKGYVYVMYLLGLLLLVYALLFFWDGLKVLGLV